MQIRSNCESAAFYRSGKVEEDKTNFHLKNLIDTQHKLIRKEYALNCEYELMIELSTFFQFYLKPTYNSLPGGSSTLSQMTYFRLFLP